MRYSLELSVHGVLIAYSNKSGNELWQTMLKKGSASGTVLPSAVSSTTATGYLPQYFGHAAASLSPAMSNATSSPTRVAPGAESKAIVLGGGVVQEPPAKVGENRPPREGSMPESDAMKEVREHMIRERMVRDSERNGIDGSGWQ